MTVAEAKKKLLKVALGYPEAWKDHPWGETVVKVGKKIFVFLGLANAARHRQAAAQLRRGAVHPPLSSRQRATASAPPAG